jgi:RNA polymerase sigma factor (sigma-70 family)
VFREFESLSDQELAGRIQAGSMAACEELVFRYEHRIYAFAANFCPDPRDAREVAQDTFVKAFRAMSRFDAKRGFGPWLFAIARRTCIDRHRLAPPPADAPLPELADESDPAELLADREDGRALWDLARRTLPALQFQALWLRYAEDMSGADIARVLRKTGVYVKVLLFRARERLAQALPEMSELNGNWVGTKTLVSGRGTQNLTGAVGPGNLDLLLNLRK